MTLASACARSARADVWVESADETAAKVLEAGGRVITNPFDVMDAGRMAVFTDPEGAAFCAWQANEHKGARIVNEPGSVNFNTLNTRDPERAKPFYRSVFKWETLELGGDAQMWTLPGYGDFLQTTTRSQGPRGTGRRSLQQATAEVRPPR